MRHSDAIQSGCLKVFGWLADNVRSEHHHRGATLSVVEVVAIVIVGWLLLGALLAFVLGRTIQLREKHEAPTSKNREGTHQKEMWVTGSSKIGHDELVFVGGSDLDA